MKVYDYNSEKDQVILWIHPMLSCAKEMERFVTKDYRFLIPDLSIPYQSAKIEAQAIYSYLMEKNLHHVSLGFGASLGGVVLMELVQYKDIHFDHLFFEGTSLYENASSLCVLMTKTFLKKYKKVLRNPKIVAFEMEKDYGMAQAKTMAEQFARMDENSLRAMVYDCTHVTLPKLSNAVFAYGARDFFLKEAKKRMPQVYPNASLKVWKKMNHCSKMLDKDYFNLVLGCCK